LVFSVFGCFNKTSEDTGKGPNQIDTVEVSGSTAARANHKNKGFREIFRKLFLTFMPG